LCFLPLPQGHGSFLPVFTCACGMSAYALGFYRENRWMTFAAVVNILIGRAIHLALYFAGTRMKIGFTEG
jgi:hypothetical protein